MNEPERSRETSAPQAAERGAALALFPLLGATCFYLLPNTLQQNRLLQFVPQLLAYVGLGLWALANGHLAIRLGLQRHQFHSGLLWGAGTGLALGLFNLLVILRLAPSAGYDITFLTKTPHAQIPLLIMVPWFIVCIAIMVEVNFRGFLLGRLVVLGKTWLPAPTHWLGSPLAVVTSALVFAFDPFLVATFKHLHWIAIWDGLIWGLLYIRLQNLYVPIVAHAVEVMIMYCVVRAALN